MTIPLSARVPVAARRPTIVTWNRLEGVPRATDFSRSLRAEVRDGLWMLARQWQVGEFEASDAGTPVVVNVTTATEIVADSDLPLETRVEREPGPLDLRLSIQVGQQWLRVLRDHVGDDRYRSLFLGKYPFAMPPSSDERARQWAAAARSRALDGVRLMADFAAGVAASDATHDALSIAPGDAPQVAAAQQALVAWFARTNPDANKSWAPEQLEYRFDITASSLSSSTTLRSAEYRSGHLDWHDFDVAARAGATAPTRSVSMLPAPITFVGMPSTRWWEVEDHRLDFGAVDVHPTDLAKLVMIEFGLIYGSDWNIVPLSVPVGSLTHITALEVKDVFGQTTTVPSLQVVGAPWSMFTLSGSRGSSPGLFVPPALAATIESPPIEAVDILRDEMANMVWAIESFLPDGLGSGAAVRNHAPEVATSGSVSRYQLMGHVPPSWIPFLPTHVPGSSREIQLQRGAMLDENAAPIVPRGAILRPAGSQPYFIHEEEVPRVGVRVTRTWQRARWLDGSTHVWLGRKRACGRGEGSSGLAFDRVVEGSRP